MSMIRGVGAIALVAGFAVYFPQKFMGSYDDGASGDTKVAKVSTKRSGPAKAVGYRRGGQFTFNAMLNGTSVKVLVDTGATSVAINERTARRIGITLDDSDFRHTATTANGTTKFAVAHIKSISIDSVTVRNVRAAVLRDSSLGETLLGMSFLNKLEKFEFDGNKLTLYQ